MRILVIMVLAVGLALAGCEAFGPGDVAPSSTETIVKVPPPGQPRVQPEPPSVANPVLTPEGPGTEPAGGLQYDGSIAFRRGTK